MTFKNDSILHNVKDQIIKCDEDTDFLFKETQKFRESTIEYIGNLEARLYKLENFLKKIMPMLPDEIKLYLELAEDEGEQ